MKKCIWFLGVVFLIVGEGCADKRKYHDIAPESNTSSISDKVKEIVQFQRTLDKTFKNPDSSPLPDRYRKDFEGLDFYSPDTQYIVQGILKKTPNPMPFMMPTNTERLSEEMVYGVIEFSLKGEPYKVEVYQNVQLKDSLGFKDYLFLPFLDKTNGEETYDGGRYLDLTIPEGDLIVLDFNKAYNPYCAYNKKYSCPLVPKVNYINTKIRAGVKRFKLTDKK
ncbi:DUF1684 domain-containing protein [Eudoraea sp.]|uniref:DUF1684 domain-containing protein n=1 Tax=Eudoraea sp. TaxID=1979955 RepID=UPI003C716134